MRANKIPMQPGALLTNDDCPKFPDPLEQRMYLSLLAKAQFAAQLIWYDTSYTISQLSSKLSFRQ